MAAVDGDQVGSAVAAARDAQKLSVRKAAERGGVGASTWSDLEAGKYPPNKNSQRAVSTALRWPLDWHERLLAGEDWHNFPVETAVDEITQLRDAVARLSRQVEWLTSHVEELTGDVRPPLDVASRIQSA